MDQFLLKCAQTSALLPLLAAILSGLFGKKIGRVWSHRICIVTVSISFLITLYLFSVMVLKPYHAIDSNFYLWGSSGIWQFHVGFLLDRLSVTMMTVVLFVSFMVHVYTISYMEHDSGYQRFFSYVSLFTFSMLILVLANNFLVLFFGWEAVGLVSYLLIGFWFDRHAATRGGLKAFIVNRVGDMALLLGIACVLMHFDTLNYSSIFQQVSGMLDKQIDLFPNYSVPLIPTLALLFFIGAMGKSAQVPLHIWLPESMEGPTPISALIHAATMVTAGIYLMARLSPLIEYSETVLNFILVIGATTAFFIGILALFQQDIKRVIAYSTISQLGYMAAAVGASAYQAAIFHLVTHAFFKALLFLAAGSVIIAMHHEQDMRKMGGLCRYLPITYITFLIGALALSALPPFSGFFSKEAIIEAVHGSQLSGAHYAYLCLVLGAFLTPTYIFRAFFLTFHGEKRFELASHDHHAKAGHAEHGHAQDGHSAHTVKEAGWTMWVPLILLAIPSMVVGQCFVMPMLYSEPNLLGNSIFILATHKPEMGNPENTIQLILSAGHHLTFWLSVLGISLAWICCVLKKIWWDAIQQKTKGIFLIFENHYFLDALNELIFVRGSLLLSRFFYEVTDIQIIDRTGVNGSGRLIQWLAKVLRRLQTGYIYHYAAFILLGVFALIFWQGLSLFH